VELKELGWDEWFEDKFAGYRESGLEPARVIAEHRERYIVRAQCGEMEAEVTGKFMYFAGSPSEFPKTGDWAAVSVFKGENKAIIHNVVERKSKFSRKAPGTITEEQVIAANLDTVFIVQGLDNNYNPARMERYASAVRAGNIEPVAVLNKSDICPEYEAKVSETTSLLKNAAVIAASALTGQGFNELESIIKKGKTYAFAGSSGAGKSSIINRLAGREIAGVAEVREKDSKGRHTTTARELFILPSGAILIDTPGMRELGLWEETGRSVPGFEDIDELAASCRFSDCRHEKEPGCMIRKAMEEGVLDPKRLKSYMKLKREAFHLRAKVSEKAAFEKKQREKGFGKMVKAVMKEKNKRKNY